MKRMTTVALALALVGYLGYSASAAEMVKEGAQRLAIIGSAEYADTFGDLTATGTSLSASAEYEYLVMDQMGLAVRGTFSWEQFQATASGAADVNYRLQNYAVELVPKWRPAVEGNISPFIGPKIGLRYVTNSGANGVGHKNVSDTTWDWGAVLGIDIFLGKNIALVVEYDYTQFKVETEASSIGVPLSVTTNIATGAPTTTSGHVTVCDSALTAGLAWWW